MNATDPQLDLADLDERLGIRVFGDVLHYFLRVQSKARLKVCTESKEKMPGCYMGSRRSRFLAGNPVLNRHSLNAEPKSRRTISTPCRTSCC